MKEFVALKPMMYAYRKIDKEVEEKRCKGTKKCVVAEGLTFDDYKTCLFDGETICISPGTCSTFSLLTITDVFITIKRL